MFPECQTNIFGVHHEYDIIKYNVRKLRHRTEFTEFCCQKHYTYIYVYIYVCVVFLTTEFCKLRSMAKFSYIIFDDIILMMHSKDICLTLREHKKYIETAKWS